jgi:hypothetical protein
MIFLLTRCSNFSIFRWFSHSFLLVFLERVLMEECGENLDFFGGMKDEDKTIFLIQIFFIP